MANPYKQTYSMFKSAGSGWSSELVEVVATDLNGGPATLQICGGGIVLSKTYSRQSTGQIYDNFMWLASMAHLDLAMLTSAGFQPNEQL